MSAISEVRAVNQTSHENVMTVLGAVIITWRRRRLTGSLTRRLRRRRDDGNENGKKAIGLDWQNNNFARITHFCTFFAAVTPPTTWNFLFDVLWKAWKENDHLAQPSSEEMSFKWTRLRAVICRLRGCSPYWMAPEVFPGHYFEKADVVSLSWQRLTMDIES